MGDNVFAQVNPLFVTKPPGSASGVGNPLPQVITIATTSTTALSFGIATVNSSGGSWLSVSPAAGCCYSTPQAITATINPSAALPAGTYVAQIQITQYGGAMSLTIPITLTVGGSGTAFFDDVAGDLSFSTQPSGTAPPSQPVLIRNAGSGSLNWTLTVTTADGGNWLSANALSGTAPTQVNAAVAPQYLPGGGILAGTFIGQLLFQAPGNSVTVPVVMTVGSNVFNQVNPIYFTKPYANTSNPLPQTITISTTGAALSVGLSFANANGGTWLSISPAAGCCYSTPQAVTAIVTADPQMAPGTYTAQIQVTQYGGAMSITVPVTLTIAASTDAFFDNLPGGLSFSMVPQGTAPPSQPLQIRNAGSGTLSWTLTSSTSDGGNWLNPSPLSGTAPDQVSVGILPQYLPGGGILAGTFTGQLLFQTGDNSITVPVTMVVGTNVLTQVNPLYFTKPYGLTMNPLPQDLTVSITGATALSVGLAVENGTGGSWLSISPSAGCCYSTPQVITATVTAPAAMAVGNYTAQIVITQYGGAQSITIPVTLTVAATNTTFFDNVQGQMGFAFTPGSGNPPGQTVQLRNGGSGGTLNWTVTATTADGGNWLVPSSLSGTAPQTVTVNVVSSALPNLGLVAGTFEGELLFQTPGSSVTVPVSVAVGPNVYTPPTTLTFTKAFGGSNPLSQNVTFGSTGTAISFGLSSSGGTGGNWLSISPAAGCCYGTPKVVTASITAPTQMPSGTYTGQIVATTYGGSSASTIPVILIVQGGPPTLSITKTHSGSFTQGGTGTYTVTVSNSASAGPTSGTVTVTDTAPAGLTVTGMSGSGWTCTTLPTCTTSNVLNAGQSFAPITVTVSVASNASASLTNQASVSGGGSASNSANDPTTINPQSTAHPAFFNGEVALSGGVYYLQFPDGSVFGYYNYQGFPPFFYSYSLGFEAFIDGGNGAAYLYDFTSNHWWYTSPTLFPYLYDFSLNNWLYFFTNSTTPRYFSDITTGKIITQ